VKFTREVITALVLLVIAVAIGVATDALGWALFGATVIWSTLQWLEFRKLQSWAAKPLRAPANAARSWYSLSITPYRTLQRERQRSRQFVTRLREVMALVEVIPDAVIILNNAGEIEGFNAAAQRLLRLSDSDRGIGLASVVRSPDFVAFLREGLNNAILEFPSPFDADKTLEARSFSVEQNRFVVLVRDNTELNRLLTMRQNFIANVSHELRTPLTVVSGYLETIADPTQPDDLRLGLIERLTSPIGRIRSLVDDLLLLTRLESTPMPSQLDPVSMTQVISNAVHEVQGLAQHPTQISVNCSSNAKVLGIEAELYSVCINLLSNALRYSQEGNPVEISWRELSDDVPDTDEAGADSGRKIRLMVKDCGVGIAPEHLHRITERFYRVDMADARTRGGTGLGLAIVKHVLRRHNSELHVTSVVGEGSEFYCDFTAAELPSLNAVNQPRTGSGIESNAEV